jgi:hypothetical protein
VGASPAAAHDSQVSPGDRFLESLVAGFAILVQGMEQVLIGLFPSPLPLVNDAEIAVRVARANVYRWRRPGVAIAERRGRSKQRLSTDGLICREPDGSLRYDPATYQEGTVR